MQVKVILLLFSFSSHSCSFYSKTSFNPGFISSVGPRAAVISGNGSVLSEQVYESVKLLSAEVFNTDECGTVEFIADRNGFCGVKRERSGEDEL